jgi:hypothetical protein
VATVPASITVTAGATSAKFVITTNPPMAATAVLISAAYGGVAKTALLTVNAVDTITIQRAEYARSRKELRVDATSTEPTAMLRVYVTATGAFIGTLTNNGGRYSGLFQWQTNPKNITVRSSFGGSASKAVTLK